MQQPPSSAPSAPVVDASAAPIVVGEAAPAAPVLDTYSEDTNMKRLFWEPIKRTESLKKTYWTDMHPEEVTGEDEALLTELFIAKPHTAQATAIAAAQKTAAATTATTTTAAQQQQPPPQQTILAQPRAQAATAAPSSASQFQTPPPFFPQLPDEFPVPRSYSPSKSGQQSQSQQQQQPRRGGAGPIHHPSLDSDSMQRSASPLSVLRPQRNGSNGSNSVLSPPEATRGMTHSNSSSSSGTGGDDARMIISTSPASPPSVLSSNSNSSSVSSVSMSAGSSNTNNHTSHHGQQQHHQSRTTSTSTATTNPTGSSTRSKEEQRESTTSSQPSSRRGSLVKESDNLRLPPHHAAPITGTAAAAAAFLAANPTGSFVAAETPKPAKVDLGKSPKLSLGEMLAVQFGGLAESADLPERPKRCGAAMSRTPQPRSRTLRAPGEKDNTRRFSGGGPELFTRAEELSSSLQRRQLANSGGSSNSSPPAILYRPMTPQHRSRTLGLHSEVKIDRDLTPNFVFLNNKTPLMAAHLPPPSPVLSGGGGSGGSDGGSHTTPSSTSRSIGGKAAQGTPRNLEIGAQHAYNATASSSSSSSSGGSARGCVEGGLAPRRWEFSPAPPALAIGAGTGTTTGGLSPSHIHIVASSHGGAGGGAGMKVSLTPGGGVGGSGPSNPSPTGGAMHSPILLGSGILADVESTTGRVVETLALTGGAVMVDEEAIVDLVTAHRFKFAKAARHQDGEFVTQLLQRKYNSAVAGNGPDKAELLAGRTEDAAQVLSADAMRVAVPFAPREWFFSPANLPLVLSFHLVLCALDFGLSDVPAPPPLPTLTLLPPTTDLAQAHAAAERADAEAAARAGPREPYSSLDLARSLATVARSSPHAFDADRLSRMDTVRLGSWLQPDIFAEALRSHPELLTPDDAPTVDGVMLASPASVERSIPFTYPGLAERARILREVGFVLLRAFNGSTRRLVEQADHSASKLVDLLTQHFASFRDAAIYKGRFVFLYSRAQSFVRNIWIAFHGTSLGAFHDMSEITPQADALLPPIMHALGLLRYSREMRGFVESGTDFTNLPAEVEVEMRCAAAYVVKRITQVLENLGISVMKVQMDLWLRSHYDARTHSFVRFFRDDEADMEEDEDPENHDYVRREPLPNLPMLPAHYSTGLWY